MMDIRELFYVAGVVEGEGSFMHNKCLCISVQMTDRDIVERISRCFGIRARGPYQPKQKNAKPTWVCGVYGQRAAGWMMTLWTLMGERRRAQIEKALDGWKASHLRRHKGLPAKCHPQRKNKARGQCSACYQRDRKHRIEKGLQP